MPGEKKNALDIIQKNSGCLSYYCGAFCLWDGNEAHAQGQEENEKIVRVGWYQSDMFQEGISDEQIKSGYCYDYLQKVSDYTNWEYEYVYGSWTG